MKLMTGRLALAGAFLAVLAVTAAVGAEEPADQAAPDFESYSKETLVDVAKGLHERVALLEAEVTRLQAIIRDRGLEKPVRKPDGEEITESKSERLKRLRVEWRKQWQDEHDRLKREDRTLRVQQRSATGVTRTTIGNKLQKLEQQINAWEAKYENYAPPLKLAKGEVGRIDGASVHEVVDAENVVVKIGNDFFWIEAIDTSGMATKKAASIEPPIEVVGNREFKYHRWAPVRTIFVGRPILAD